MSNKIKSLIIILALFSFLSVGASFDVTENVTTVNLLVDNPIIPGPDSPIIPCPDGSDQFADGPVIPAPDGNDGIIFPNPVPPTTSAVTSIS